MDLDLVIVQIRKYVDKNKMTLDISSIECKMLLTKLEQFRIKNLITNEEINKRLME
jgi:hypothetical protein